MTSCSHKFRGLRKFQSFHQNVGRSICLYEWFDHKIEKCFRLSRRIYSDYVLLGEVRWGNCLNKRPQIHFNIKDAHVNKWSIFVRKYPHFYILSFALYMCRHEYIRHAFWLVSLEHCVTKVWDFFKRFYCFIFYFLFDFWRGLGIFLFTTASETALGPIHPPIQWAPGAFSLRVKRHRREADHLPPSSTEIKEWVEIYLHSPHTPPWRGASLKHRDNFTFTFTFTFECWGGYLDLKGRKTVRGENWIMMNFIAYILHLILLQWLNEGGW